MELVRPKPVLAQDNYVSTFLSSVMCCTYGASLMMPLQFQDWTRIEESDGEDVHVTVVPYLLGFIISEVED